MIMISTIIGKLNIVGTNILDSIIFYPYGISGVNDFLMDA